MYFVLFIALKHQTKDKPQEANNLKQLDMYLWYQVFLFLLARAIELNIQTSNTKCGSKNLPS
jgi:hypothetical protein